MTERQRRAKCPTCRRVTDQYLNEAYVDRLLRVAISYICLACSHVVEVDTVLARKYRDKAAS